MTAESFLLALTGGMVCASLLMLAVGYAQAKADERFYRRMKQDADRTAERHREASGRE